MQREADALVGNLRGFIDQPDYPTLVLGADDASLVFPIRILHDFDTQDEANLYLLFPAPCAGASAYMDTIVETLRTQREVLNTELSARGESPLPPWPLEVEDSRYPAVHRLRLLIEYCGQNLPSDRPIVWGFLPASVPDFPGYKAMIGPLLAPEKVEPWMDRHRFFVRDLAPQGPLTKELLQAKNDRILVMEVDFSNEQTERSLHATALDKSLPHDDRVFAFFQLAAIDFAFKRYPEALEKYGACFNYYHGKGNNPLASLCLLGAGDTMLQGGRPLEALKFFQQGIALSMEDKNLLTLQQGLYSAGCTSFDLGKVEDAEGYFKHSSAVSGKLCNPYTKCDAMEKQGQAQWQLGRFKDASDTWVAGKNLCVQFGYTERAHSILDRLIAAYRVSRLHSEAAAFEREKSQLGAAEGHAHVS